jgi:hypothetical protein
LKKKLKLNFLKRFVSQSSEVKKLVPKKFGNFLKLLIKNTKNLTICDKKGNSILHYCLESIVQEHKEFLSVFEELIKKSGTVNKKNIMGDTPIFVLVRKVSKNPKSRNQVFEFCY